MEGIYLINKPVGLTSYDCIRQFKRFKKGKIGHAGTLDPLASGLLVVLVGKATKLAKNFLEDNKVYTGEITLGKSTNTYDSDGEVVEELNDFNISNEEINNKMNSFLGHIKQKPPLYSAVKVKGKKLYEYARKNIEIEVLKRDSFIEEFKMTSSLVNNKFTFIAKVSKGTYIRSLAHDLGTLLNIPAHLSSLTRTSSGDFDLKNAYNLDELTSNIKPTYNLESYLSKYPKLIVNEQLTKLVKNGIYLTKKDFNGNSPLLVYSSDNQLLAYYEPYLDKYKPVILWSDYDSN